MNWKKAIKQRRKKLVSLLALAGLIAGGWYWYQSGADDGEVRYRVAKVERGPMA